MRIPIRVFDVLPDTRPIVGVELRSRRTPGPEVDILSDRRAGAHPRSVGLLVAVIAAVGLWALSRDDGGVTAADGAIAFVGALQSDSATTVADALAPDGLVSGFADIVVPLQRLAAARPEIEQPAAALDLEIVSGLDGPLVESPVPGGILVQRRDRATILTVGDHRLDGLVAVRADGGWVIDLAASVLAAPGPDVADLVAGSRSSVSPPAAARAGLVALLEGRGPDLVALTDPVREAAVRHHPDAAAKMFGSWLVQRDDIELHAVEFGSPVTLGDGARAVPITELIVDVARPDGVVRVTFDGTCATVTDGAGSSGTCDPGGWRSLGVVVPGVVVVDVGDTGWVVQPLRTHSLALTRMLDAGAADTVIDATDHWLAAWLGTESIRIVDQPPLPLRPGAEPTPDPQVPPATPADPVPAELSDIVTAALPAVPSGWQPGPSLLPPVAAADDFGVAGFVVNPADLLDFGFRGAGFASATSPDGSTGWMVTVFEWADGASAAGEFATYYGPAASDGRATYGPGDFGGPTDRGLVDQYRVIDVVDRFHVSVETWGAGDLVADATAIAGSVVAALNG